ncbi:DNA alkylation repair protein [Candidatus Roizmanbacteria bacterium]|nr:DNA alkylation repair protein [Candidatus Roizmanbacteria bacterium]
MLDFLKKDLHKLKNPQRAKFLTGFFKTGKGQYGEGDIFLGIRVPDIRKVAKKYTNLALKDVEKLISDAIHEARLAGLLVLVAIYEKGDKGVQKQIFDFYVKNAKLVNNWDLVDLTAHRIVGEHLLDKDRSLLYKLAKSDNLWEKRIAVIATYAFIKKNQYNDTLKVSKMLSHDKHDLIQKAVGWMLRETGKRDQAVLESFLKKNYKIMPRTTLRYAIERFGEKKRKFYMGK